MEATDRMKKIYYGWVIVGVGLFAKMAGLGFGRFGYPMLLPKMREALHFTYTQMGLISGAILLGYLLFSLIGGILATRFGAKKVLLASLLCGSISMFSLSGLSDFVILLFCAFGMGAGAAGTHISLTVIPMAWFGKRLLGRAVGIVVGGTGLAIIVTGLLLPPLLTSFGNEGWRACWVLMASIALVVLVISSILLRDKPNPKKTSLREDGEMNQVTASRGKGDEFSLRTIFLVYFIFGFAYNIYVTYYVSFLVGDRGLEEKTAGFIWSIFGWMSIVSGLLWGFVSDRLGRRSALLWNNGLISVALILPLCFHQTFLLGLSSFLFGLTFLGTVTIIAAAIGDHAIEKKASVYGFLTLIHGIGQLLGTTLGGYLKDMTGSFRWTLLCSLAGFLLCCIYTGLARNHPPACRPVRNPDGANRLEGHTQRVP